MSRRVILTLQLRPPFEPKPDTNLKFTVSTTAKAFEDMLYFAAQLGRTQVGAGERIFLLDDGAQISTDTVFGAIALYNKGEEKTLPFESVTYAKDGSKAEVSLQISYVQDAKRPGKATSRANAIECIAASRGLACQGHDTGNAHGECREVSSRGFTFKRNVCVYAGADKDEESSDEDGDTRQSPVSCLHREEDLQDVLEDAEDLHEEAEEGRKYSVAQYYEGQHPILHPSGGQSIRAGSL